MLVLALIALFVSRLLKRQKKRLEAKGEEERINSELSMAANIQADLLPKDDPAFPGHPEFTICASMRPAKEIGGDFYDFFLIDDDHLALAVAAVSGRGIPAALYMTMSKTLLKNTALHEESPARVLREVNARLLENHEANMSVSVWLGILEISTGKLTCANAGQEDPGICRGGRFTLCNDAHDLPVGVQEEAEYSQHTLRLEPGDKLFLYTDGVPKAVNAADDLCKNGRSDMFVTVWLGILELSTGKVVAANAGHEYPALMKHGTFTLLKDKHGFVIGGMEHMAYKDYEIRLKPGDKLFLYTDGVPEATDPDNQMFGTERMLEVLNREPEAPPRKILELVHSSVNDFVRGAEPFDDLTMLCVEYKGTGALPDSSL